MDLETTIQSLTDEQLKAEVKVMLERKKGFLEAARKQDEIIRKYLRERYIRRKNIDLDAVYELNGVRGKIELKYSYGWYTIFLPFKKDGTPYKKGKRVYSSDQLKKV